MLSMSWMTSLPVHLKSRWKCGTLICPVHASFTRSSRLIARAPVVVPTLVVIGPPRSTSSVARHTDAPAEAPLIVIGIAVVRLLQIIARPAQTGARFSAKSHGLSAGFPTAFDLADLVADQLSGGLPGGTTPVPARQRNPCWGCTASSALPATVWMSASAASSTSPGRPAG